MPSSTLPRMPLQTQPIHRRPITQVMMTNRCIVIRVKVKRQSHRHQHTSSMARVRENLPQFMPLAIYLWLSKMAILVRRLSVLARIVVDRLKTSKTMVFGHLILRPSMKLNFFVKCNNNSSPTKSCHTMKAAVLAE